MARTSKQSLLTYKALKKAIEADKLRIYLDYAKINRPTSPVYNPWECLLPILLPVLIGLLLVITVGIIFGLIFIVFMIFAYTNYFKKKIYRQLIERTKSYITLSIDSLEELWEFGGIVLVNAENKKLGCVAPEGDWKDFVILNFSEYMTEKKEEVETQEDKDKKEKPQRTSRTPRKNEPPKQ